MPGELMRQEKLNWEKIIATTHIPELIVYPDHKQIFMFSAVTWNRHHIHYSKDAAIGEGLPDVVVQRALIGNFLARLITGWAGDNAEIRKLGWRVTRSALPRKKIVCRGKIREKIESEEGKYLICELTASDENDELIASGDATVALTGNQR
jgi:hydroxyacyl-ACP dehydratase HTD2-like protein with hotdog domain